MALARLGADALAERLQRAFRAAVGNDALDARHRRADASDLCFRLMTAADHAQRRRTFLRQVLGGDPARRAGTQPAEVVGLDHRDELGLRGVEEHDDERGALGEACVELRARIAQLKVRCGHVREPSLVEAEASARRVLHRTRREIAERLLHGVDRVRGTDHRGDVGLGEIQRHGRNATSR